MAKKIQAYIDGPITDHHDLHTGGIAYVVYAPRVDDEVRCVTLVDHQGDKHERVFTEGEVKAIMQKMEDDAEANMRSSIQFPGHRELDESAVHDLIDEVCEAFGISIKLAKT